MPIVYSPSGSVAGRAAGLPLYLLTKHECGPVFCHPCGIDRRIGENPGAHQIGRTAVDDRRRPELGDAAFKEGCGVAAEQQRLGGFGRGVDDDALAAGKQPRQLFAHFLAQLVVEIGQRLVEQDEVAVLHDGASDRCALLLPAGKLARPAPQHRRQAQQVGNLAHAPVDVAGFHPGDAQRRGDVVVDGEVRVVDELLIHHGHVALLHRNTGYIGAAKMDRAGGRLLDAGHELHQRRLAGERGAEEDVERPLFEPQIGLVYVDVGADALAHIPEFERHAPGQRGSRGTLPAPGTLLHDGRGAPVARPG